MKSILKITAVFIIALSISLGLYCKFRWPLIESGYISSTSEKVAMIRPVASRIKPGTPGESLKKFFDELSAKDRSLAAIATADTHGNVMQIVKDDSLIHSGRMLDRLVQNIKVSTGNGSSGGAISSYTENGGGTGRLYVFSFNTGTVRFIAVYVFRPGTALMIRIALELLLILSISIMAAAAAFTALKKKNNPAADGKPVIQKTQVPVAETTPEAGVKPAKKAAKKVPPENGAATGIDESELSATGYSKGGPITADAAAKENPGASAVGDALNNRVFDLFKIIYRELSPENVTLYIKITGDRLSKSYQLKGKTFLRVDAPMFESIPVSDLAEASRPGAHITGNGTRIRIPLFDNETLVGLLEIILRESATALDISRLQNEVKEISRQIREFIVINNVIVDSDTGYYSSSYLAMKLGEHVYSAAKHNTDFCLMVADLFGESLIETEQKNAMMKILLSVARKAAGEKYELFNSGHRIAVILEPADRNEAERIKRALERDIAQYRIKLDGSRIIRLNPVVAYTMSTEAGSLKDILKETVEKTGKVQATV